MPLYTYKCRDCGERFDLLIGAVSEKPELKCGKCGSKNIEKLPGTFNVGRSSGKVDNASDSCPTGTCPACF